MIKNNQIIKREILCNMRERREIINYCGIVWLTSKTGIYVAIDSEASEEKLSWRGVSSCV